MIMTAVRTGMAAALIAAIAQLAAAVAPTPAEMGAARRWVTARFGSRQEQEQPDVGLYVVNNLNQVQLNARNAKPLQIGERQYNRGLYCHAPSKVIVRLPARARP